MSQGSDEYPEVEPGEAAYRLARAELASRREPHPQPAAEEATDE